MNISIVLMCLVAVVQSRKSWYYTGEFSHNPSIIGNSGYFDGKLIELDSLFRIDHNCSDLEDRFPHLYDSNIQMSWISFYGNAIIGFKEFSSFLSSEELRYLQYMLPSTSSSNIRVCGVTKYDIVVTSDYSDPIVQPIQVEIGIYDSFLNTFEDRHFVNASVGSLVACILVNDYDVHLVLYSTDLRGHFSLFRHTWHPVDVDVKTFLSSPRNLSVTTYNIWHNNPPEWIVRNGK